MVANIIEKIIGKIDIKETLRECANDVFALITREENILGEKHYGCQWILKSDGAVIHRCTNDNVRLTKYEVLNGER